VCGNRICEPPFENPFTCPIDCGYPYDGGSGGFGGGPIDAGTGGFGGFAGAGGFSGFPVDAGGCLNGGKSPPSTCVTGNDPETNSPWVVCSADCGQAWISANTSGRYHARQICQDLGYQQVGQIGGTCGNVCGYCEGGTTTSCMQPGKKNFDNAGNSGSDEFGPILSLTVQWTCVNLVPLPL
jgi:hypothetical protein